MEILLDFLHFLEPYGQYSYLVIFLVLLACGFGLPMPEDIILITGGILAARGIGDFWPMFVVCMAGVLIGDGIIFCAGRFFGNRVKSTFFYKRFMTASMDERVSQFFKRYGDKVIFMARFMPGLRMPIYLTSGMYRVSFLKFLLLDGFAAIISVPVWIWVGLVFGENLELLDKKMKQFQIGIYGLLGVAVVAVVAAILIKRRVMKRVTD